MTTTEDYLQTVRSIVLDRACKLGTVSAEDCDRLRHAKLLYGSGIGMTGVRGVTAYGTWSNGHGPTDTVEVCAAAQESWVQLAGTLVHELGHALAGSTAGHSTEWKDASRALGFVKRPMAAGQVYHLSMFPPDLRESVYRAAQTVDDGSPAFRTVGTMRRRGHTVSPRPCSAGTGTKGGTSRGAGSGSRMVKLQCERDGYTVRTTRKWIDVGLPSCPDGHTMAEV